MLLANPCVYTTSWLDPSTNHVAIIAIMNEELKDVTQGILQKAASLSWNGLAYVEN